MYPDSYLTYLIHFHGDRDYFECHEILEEYWKSLPQSARISVWVGLIQVAVALYHHRRGNFAGAGKMMQSGIEILSHTADQVTQLGLDQSKLHQLLTQRLAEIKQCRSYTSIALPIADPVLLQRCQQMCEEKGFLFGQESDLTNNYLLNKHRLRDRSDVLADRDKSLQAKRDKAK